MKTGKRQQEILDRINKINTIGRQTDFRQERHEAHEETLQF
jgi:hypothetical protein